MANPYPVAVQPHHNQQQPPPPLGAQPTQPYGYPAQQPPPPPPQQQQPHYPPPQHQHHQYQQPPPQFMGQPPPQMQPQPVVWQQPPQQPAPPPQQPQQMVPGQITVDYLAPGPCGDCGCGQPGKRCSFNILINGKEVGTLRQGHKSVYPAAQGTFTIKCQEGGIGGSISRFFGGESGGSQCQVVRTLGPGQQTTVTIGWQRDCCASKAYPYMI